MRPTGRSTPTSEFPPYTYVADNRLIDSADEKPTEPEHNHHPSGTDCTTDCPAHGTYEQPPMMSMNAKPKPDPVDVRIALMQEYVQIEHRIESIRADIEEHAARLHDANQLLDNVLAQRKKVGEQLIAAITPEEPAPVGSRGWAENEHWHQP